MTTVVAMSPEGGQKFPRGLHDVYWGITPPFQEPSGSAFDPQLVRHPLVVTAQTLLLHQGQPRLTLIAMATLIHEPSRDRLTTDSDRF